MACAWRVHDVSIACESHVHVRVHVHVVHVHMACAEDAYLVVRDAERLVRDGVAEDGGAARAIAGHDVTSLDPRALDHPVYRRVAVVQLAARCRRAELQKVCARLRQLGGEELEKKPTNLLPVHGDVHEGVLVTRGRQVVRILRVSDLLPGDRLAIRVEDGVHGGRELPRAQPGDEGLVVADVAAVRRHHDRGGVRPCRAAILQLCLGEVAVIVGRQHHLNGSRDLRTVHRLSQGSRLLKIRRVDLANHEKGGGRHGETTSCNRFRGWLVNTSPGCLFRATYPLVGSELWCSRQHPSVAAGRTTGRRAACLPSACMHD